MHTLRSTLVVVTMVMASAVASAVQVVITAPASVPAGSTLEIHWTGGNDASEFLTIVTADAPSGSYQDYTYADAGVWETTAPEVPGSYEIRYLAADSPYPTLARVALKVTAVTATVEVPASVAAGSAIPVSWTGPDNPRDFITIVKAGAPEKSYESYAYTEEGSPLELPAPEEPGTYEVRYLTSVEYHTLAASAITVGSVSATLEVPASVAAGSPIKVSWTGPGNPRDFITIVKAGAPEKSYASYAYTEEGSPLELPAPEEPGTYEIRYLSGAEYLTLAATPITVGSVSASLAAPDRVRAGEPFSVSWKGPDNAGDFIAIAPAGSSPDTWPYYEFTGEGSPVTLVAPLEAGDYELRYQTGRTYRVLATAAVRVGPAEQRPGTLRVLTRGGAESTAGLTDSTAVELILDASGSMLQRMGSTRRIDIAKQVLGDLVRHTIPAGAPFALRVFGHRESGSCRSDLESPLGPLDPEKAITLMQAIEAKNLAKTPLAGSLAMVESDLAAVQGQRIVVLVTDGEETCDGDPAAAIEKLRAAGIDVRVNIVGFAIDDVGLKQEFRYWAELGGGRYFDAGSADRLAASLVQALQAPYEVMQADGTVVATGLVNGDAVTLPAGQYRINVRAQPGRVIEGVTVTAGETATITLDDR